MSISETNASAITIFPLDKQGTGSFDGGRITETKPIGFPGESSGTSRVGPLFYWAWAKSHGPALIALHPHKGFEIASYLLKGELGHRDTGGHESRVQAGGIQVMQTGSGISHEERTFDEPTEFFQIWFEPDLKQALTRAPKYFEASSEQLPVTLHGDIQRKSILGGNSPLQLVVDTQLEHLTFPPSTTYQPVAGLERTLAFVIIKGEFTIQTKDDSQAAVRGDFVITNSEQGELQINAGADGGEFVMVNVPTEVSYPLLST